MGTSRGGKAGKEQEPGSVSLKMFLWALYHPRNWQGGLTAMIRGLDLLSRAMGSH